jgi:hypothetical protein
MRIEYTDKENVATTDIAENRKVTATNMNEIKSKHNLLVDALENQLEAYDELPLSGEPDQLFIYRDEGKRTLYKFNQDGDPQVFIDDNTVFFDYGYFLKSKQLEGEDTVVGEIGRVGSDQPYTIIEIRTDTEEGGKEATLALMKGRDFVDIFNMDYIDSGNICGIRVQSRGTEGALMPFLHQWNNGIDAINTSVAFRRLWTEFKQKVIFNTTGAGYSEDGVGKASIAWNNANTRLDIKNETSGAQVQLKDSGDVLFYTPAGELVFSTDDGGASIYADYVSMLDNLIVNATSIRVLQPLSVEHEVFEKATQSINSNTGTISAGVRHVRIPYIGGAASATVNLTQAPSAFSDAVWAKNSTGTNPTATNLCLWSQAFDNAVWTKSALGTGVAAAVTPNDAVAPDGTTTADLIVFDRGAGNTINDRSEITQAPTVVSATTYNTSIYLKAATGGDVGKQIALRGVDQSVWVTITLTANWVRYERASVSASTAGTILLANRGTLTADNTVSVHAWQGQIELGSVASYRIITSGGSAPGPGAFQANVAIAPDGTMTADRIFFLNQADADAGLNQTHTVLGSTNYVNSIFVRGEGTDIGKQIRVRLRRTTGTFVSNTTTITLTGDWQRVPTTLTTLSDNTGVQVVYSSAVGGAETVLMWHSQFELGSVATAPIVSLTNFALHPQDFTQAAWDKTISGSVTANTGVAPDGTTTADTFTAGANGSQIQQAYTGISGATYTASFFIRRLVGNGVVNLRAVENVNTPITINSTWQRYSLSVTSTTTTIRIGLTLGTIGDAVEIWGAQLELGSVATYPTYNYVLPQATGSGRIISIKKTTTSPYNYAIVGHSVSTIPQTIDGSIFANALNANAGCTTVRDSSASGWDIISKY